MAKSSDTFNKKEKEKKRLAKRKEKDQRKEERKAAAKDGKSFEDMIAYVDENGNFSSTPPDLTKKRVIKETEIELTSRNKGGMQQNYVKTGNVKFFDKDKGFGFIKDDITQEEIFFHFKSANFPIAQSDKVTYETAPGPKGLNAVRIAKAGAMPPPAPAPAAPVAPPAE
jgi:cold shock CspA family protein